MPPTIAFILDGVPSDTMLTLYWLRCILVPLFVILFSEIIVLHCRKPFPTLIALCAVAAVVVLRPAYNLIDWGYPFFPPWQFVAAPWIGALSPFVVRFVRRGVCRLRRIRWASRQNDEYYMLHVPYP